MSKKKNARDTTTFMTNVVASTAALDGQLSPPDDTRDGHPATVAPATTPTAATARPSRRKSSPSSPVYMCITTNLPDRLPVLPTEIALIAAWWPSFVELLSANDNACDPSNEGHE